MSVILILIALLLLIAGAWAGLSVLVLAPLLAALAALASGMPVLAGYTQVFMTAAGGFVIQFFPLFLLGALFGKVMEASGAAERLAQAIAAALGPSNAILAVVLACAALTYGGVSLFVVAFAAWPLARALFAQTKLPARLIPATIALGAFTFTMTALPGTPAIQNAIPMPYFDTTPFAAPGLGTIGGLVMFAVGIAWLQQRLRVARRGGQGYGEEEPPGEAVPRRKIRAHAQGEGYDVVEIARMVPAGGEPVLPGFAVALAPVVLVVALNYLFAAIVFPALDTGYLALPAFGATTVASVKGIWAIIGALTLSCLLIVALNPSVWGNLRRTLDDGANAAVAPIFNTASLVGFGAVVAILPAFADIRDAVLGMAPGNPLISLSVAVNVLAGITGSASGGMSIALQTLGASYLEMGRATGIAPELMHRVTAIATGGLDALPHNGAVITLLSICQLSHRQAYADIFMVAVVGPILALAVVVLLGTVLGSF